MLVSNIFSSLFDQTMPVELYNVKTVLAHVSQHPIDISPFVTLYDINPSVLELIVETFFTDQLDQYYLWGFRIDQNIENMATRFAHISDKEIFKAAKFYDFDLLTSLDLIENKNDIHLCREIIINAYDISLLYSIVSTTSNKNLVLELVTERKNFDPHEMLNSVASNPYVGTEDYKKIYDIVLTKYPLSNEDLSLLSKDLFHNTMFSRGFFFLLKVLGPKVFSEISLLSLNRSYLNETKVPKEIKVTLKPYYTSLVEENIHMVNDSVFDCLILHDLVDLSKVRLSAFKTAKHCYKLIVDEKLTDIEISTLNHMNLNTMDVTVQQFRLSLQTAIR